MIHETPFGLFALFLVIVTNPLAEPGRLRDTSRSPA